MMKKVSLNNNIKDTFYRLSSKQIYSTESVVVETNTIGDKLKEMHYGDNVIVYRGAQAIYGYNNKTKELNWVYDSLNNVNEEFDFDSNIKYNPKTSISIQRNGDGSVIMKRFRTIWNDRVIIKSQVLTLKKEHTKFQKMYDLLVFKDLSKYFGVNNKGISICEDLFNSIIYSRRIDDEYMGDKIINKKNKKVIHDGFLYDKDMIWIGIDENTRYNSYTNNTYIYFMDDIKNIEEDTFANRVKNSHKNDAYIIITPNSLNIYNNEIEKICSLVIDESYGHPKITLTLFNGEWVHHISRVRDDIESGDWLSVEVIAEGKNWNLDKRPYAIKLYKSNGICTEGHALLSNFIARVEDDKLVLDEYTKKVINDTLVIKDNDDIIYKSSFRRTPGVMNVVGYVESTLSPNIILHTPFDIQIIQSPTMVIKNTPEDKPELVFNCVIDGDLLPTLQNAISVINKDSVYYDIFKNIVTYTTESITVSDYENPNLLSTKLYNHFVDMYNEKPNDKLIYEVNDSVLLEHELQRFMNGEIKEIKMKISYREAKEVLEKNGFDVCDRDYNDGEWRWETNGWQCDYWTFAMKDGIKYDIEGGLFYNDFSMVLSEECAK